jgi:hypothetical protein
MSEPMITFRFSICECRIMGRAVEARAKEPARRFQFDKLPKHDGLRHQLHADIGGISMMSEKDRQAP